VKTTELLRFNGAQDRDAAIDAWMKAHAGELGAIAHRWFEVMLGCGDEVRELLHDGCPVACLGDVPFGYVNVFTSHVNVGFFQGASLADPARILEGTGKSMRHVKLRPGAAVNAIAMSKLIQAAYSDIKARVENGELKRSRRRNKMRNPPGARAMREQPLREMPRIWPNHTKLLVDLALAALGLMVAAPAVAQDAPTTAPASDSAQQAPPSSPDPAAPGAALASPDAVWQQNLAAWRAAREQGIAAPNGWLTLIGMDWLKPGVNTVGTAADNAIRIRADAPEHIGILTVIGKTVQLLAPTGGFPADLQVDGAPAREGELEAGSSSPASIAQPPMPSNPPVLAWHGLTLAVLARGDRFALRIKDADAVARTGFYGLNWYAPDAKFLVEAKWIPFTPPRILKIPTILGTTIDLPSPGVAEFRLGNATLRLEPVLEEPNSQILFFLLRDATSRTTTYATARYLHTGLPDHGLDLPGTIILDFNRLENPPCAYSLYATCPLPPEQNRLAVAIEAGEKRYAP
jgi:uncharacterized protein (DUF1684 family)